MGKLERMDYTLSTIIDIICMVLSKKTGKKVTFDDDNSYFFYNVEKDFPNHLSVEEVVSILLK